MPDANQDKTVKVDSQSTPERPPIGGRYQIVELLGKGGAGSVYLAEHLSLGKKVAVKIITSREDEARERLAMEARACAALDHPGLVSVIDYGIDDDGSPFIAMEFVKGESLEALLRQGSFAPPRALSIVRQAADALAHAHKQGVIHRDIKPSNLIVWTDQDGDDAVTIVDFGIAKALLPEGEMQRLTSTGNVLGSPSYMSPEQIRGEEIDERSDIYSLGCLLYELLTGTKAFRGDSLLATMTLHLESSPAPIETVKPDLKNIRDLSSILSRCLARDKDNRFASMKELESAIEQFENLRKKSASRKNSLSSVPAIAAPLLTAIVAATAAWHLKPVAEEIHRPGQTFKSESKPGSERRRSTIIPPGKLSSMTEKYAPRLAKAEVLYYSDNARAAYKIYQETFEEAFTSQAPDEFQLALGLFAMDAARESSDLNQAAKILASLKEPLARAENGEKDTAGLSFLAASVLYYDGALHFDLAKSEKDIERRTRLVRTAAEYCSRSLNLLTNSKDPDERALVLRVKTKLKEIAGWRRPRS
ncbi:MAG: serine/threonine protein kinase [Candidatus Melainabacteria bacterium]|nr:serine/threonine protein kinase [Candidatus Melainabacteria bacterium]